MHALVLQSDFGLADGAVASMFGVAKLVDSDLEIYSLTHEIPQYDIWAASCRLIQTISYWPKGTVFVSVVDPGVGSSRRSIAIETRSGHYVITPDNGTLTHLFHQGQISRAFVIDENRSRLPHSEHSNTFYGRDIYAYNGARLAANKVTIEEIGQQVLVDSIDRLPVTDPILEDSRITGTIDILDVRYGSLWTNIPFSMIQEAGIARYDTLMVSIFYKDQCVYQNIMKFVRSFAEVGIGEPLAYINSMVQLGIAVNQKSFSELYNIGYGNDWKIRIKKLTPEQIDIIKN